MPDTLAVDINRTGRKSLDVPGSYEADGPFAVELRNHGEPAHVYLNLDEALSEAMSLDTTNYYVEAGVTQRVRVHVDPQLEDSIQGQLKIATGYGAETRYVNVRIDRTPERSIEVDPSLGEPRPRETAPAEDSGIGLDVIPPVVLGLVAVALAGGAVVSAPPTKYAFAGLAVVAAGLAAGYFAVR